MLGELAEFLVASDLVYDMRMAAYCEGLAEFMPASKVPPVKIIFVEQSAPHDVRVKTISDKSLAAGWDKWQESLTRIAECQKTGVWPGCDPAESELEFFGGEDLGLTLNGEPLT